MNKIHNYFMRVSCERIGPTTLDWLRSLYFALVGSSILNFALKITALSKLSIFGYLIAISLLVWGLVVSVRIAGRFKDYEKTYPNDVKDSEEKHFAEYCKDRDVILAHQHTFLYLLWIPAIALIGFIGFTIEHPDDKKNEKIETLLLTIEKKENDIEVMKTQLNKIYYRLDSVKAKLDSAKIIKLNRPRG